MPTRREKLRIRLPLLIGAIPFLATGIDALVHGKVFFGTVNVAMAAANLLALRFAEKTPAHTQGVLFVLNALVAWVVGWDYYLAGKKGLPYAWLVVGFFYSIAALVVVTKKPRNKTPPDPPDNSSADE